MAKSRKSTNNKNKTKKSAQHNIEVIDTSFQTNMMKIGKCIFIVAIIFVVMYFVTVLILKKAPYQYSRQEEKTSIQYDEILAGTTFQKKDNEYFVLFYHMDDDTTYTSLISDYRAKEEHLPIYYVDLDNKMNQSVIAEESNSGAQNATELKIKDATLIRIKDGKIEEYLEDSSEIKSHLSE